MTSKPPYYRIYLLTVWQEQSRSPPPRTLWRFRLEDPRTGSQQAFTDVATMLTALQKLASSIQGGDSMLFETHKALVHRWVAAINTQDLAELDTLLSPALAQEWKETILPWVYGTFANHHTEIEAMLAEGEHVAIWVATSGVHTGEFEGVPPTGRQWTNKGVILLRLRDNRIVEVSWIFDDLALLKQVGATVTLAN